MTDALALAVGGVSVSRETFSKLEAFEDLVRRWNSAINLVGKATLPQLRQRHTADSAQLFSLAPGFATHWVDVGSGGGFPGIVVAILAQELKAGMRVTLVESDLRKATFLRQAVQSLGLQTAVISDRIELISPQEADVLSARALAPLTDLLQHAKRHLHPEGVALFPKGARYREELEEGLANWSFDIDVRPSLSDSEAAILMIRKVDLARQN